MAVKVVDASALAALLFDEAAADEIDNRLASATLAAPSLLCFEMANVCWTKRRQYPERSDALLQALLLLDGLPIATHEVDHPSVLIMAEQMSLTTYDASYLWLARQLQAELVTLDRQLARAATALD